MPADPHADAVADVHAGRQAEPPARPVPGDSTGRGAGAALPSALLLDMDGTLVDSEAYWMAEETALVAEHGGTWTHEDALRLVGNPLPVSAQILREAGVDLPVEAIVDRLLAGVTARFVADVPWRPGARELLAEATGLHIPCALVTMSYASFADELLARAPAGAFTTAVTGDAVTHGKPHPEPYLTACERLGVDPATALAVEDSVTGARSAVAAGVPTIAVPLMVPVPASVGATVVDTLAGRPIADLWAAATA